jgi:hypothetical protein
MGCYSLCARGYVELAISLAGHFQIWCKITNIFSKISIFLKKMAGYLLDVLFLANFTGEESPAKFPLHLSSLAALVFI